MHIGNFIAFNIYFRKEATFQINHLNLPCQKLEVEQTKTNQMEFLK